MTEMNEAKFKLGDYVIAEGVVENVGCIEAADDALSNEWYYFVRFEDGSNSWYFQYELDYVKEEEHADTH